MATMYEVTRDVPAGERFNWTGRDVAKGEVFQAFTGVTYGSCDTENGVIVCENPAGPFFEFPRDAVRRADQ